MTPFALERPGALPDAIRAALVPDAEFIAGGTDMVQLMKEGLRRPGRLVDLGRGAIDDRIEVGDAGLRLGAGATMEAVATDPRVARGWPALAQSLLESASVQVRNLATVGGNLLQRTRCGYFRDPGAGACNRRLPGSGCAALGGENRMLAVLGTSEACIATHASDLAVALLALDATLRLAGPEGERAMPLAGLHRTTEDRPEIETNLRAGEVITAIEVPGSKLAAGSLYLKVRDRASFEWSLLSAAVGIEAEGGQGSAPGTIRRARVAMGGVGTVPWRMGQVEAALEGRPLDAATLDAAARLCTNGARGRGRNDFKLTLMPTVLGRALRQAGGLA